MSKPIPVSNIMLRWARESMHLSVEEVAERMKKDVSDIEDWESGESSPTYVQLETLAYTIYKRPVALFFFPNPPDEETVEQAFRTLPEYELERIPPRLLFLLRKARVLQMNLAELYEGANPAKQKILYDLDISPNTDSSEMAKRVRSYLGVDLTEQQNWQGTDEAIICWRNTFEKNGVFIFKDSFNPPGRKKAGAIDSPFSGFCLYDPDFPVIYVNNNKPKSRQIFTLFHELAHLLMRTGGIDTRRDDFIEYMTGENKRIEILCNQFAADLLVPLRDFESRTAGKPLSDKAIEEWANLYCVSRETILRRLLEQDRINQKLYESKARQWQNERATRRGGGGNHYRTKGVYLGERYIEKVFSNYHKGRISLEQVADYLDEKTKNVAGMEDWLFTQGAEV